MRVKVSEAIGNVLDRMVAKALAEETGEPIAYGWDSVEGKIVLLPYTTNSGLLGPILERKGISYCHDSWKNDGCNAFIARGSGVKSIVASMHGPDALVAGARCFVASVLGEEVEEPAVLN